MRYIRNAAAILLLASGLVFAQSPSVQPTNVQSADNNASQPAVRTAAQSDVESRLNALEHKLDQLENRVNAVLPSNPSAAPADMGDRLNALDQKLSILEEHNAKVVEGPTVTAGRDTFSISSPDKTFRLRIGGHLQLDSKTFADDKPDPSATGNSLPVLADGFAIRRARPIVEGDLGKYVDFRFMPDFGNGKAVVQDAYADLKAEPYAYLRGGKFKTPLGLEVLQNDADRTFIEESLVSDLVPNRDEGFQVGGNILGRVDYQAAVMNGAPDGTNLDGASGVAPGSTLHDGKDAVTRVFATPFGKSDITFLKGLGFGVAASTGRQDEGASLPQYLSTGGQAMFFAYNGLNAKSVFTDGRRLTYTPQAYYYVGPFGLMAEYADTSQYIGLTTSANKTYVRDFDNHAWEVAGSWVITGEKKSFKTVVPRNGLEIDGQKGPGAWELVARYTELDVDPLAFANLGTEKSPIAFADPSKVAEAARAWVVGVNWYLNYFTKLAFNYEQTHFQDGAGTIGLLANRPTEKAIMERLQIAF